MTGYPKNYIEKSYNSYNKPLDMVIDLEDQLAITVDELNSGILNTTTTLKLDQTTPQSVVNGSPIMEGIQFDITPSTTNIAEGLLRWNSTDGTLDLGMSSGIVTMQLGQEMFIKVRNDAGGSTIANATPVYIAGRTGVFPEIAPAKSDSDTTSRCIGITTQDIDSPGFGYVTTFGYVRGIKTNYIGSGVWGTTWSAGDRLYISKTLSGQLTNVEPSSPHHSDIVGIVGIVSSNQGSILVNIVPHKTLEELTDVNGTALITSGQFPVWNQDLKYFDFNYNIDDYVPYTGAKKNVNLGSRSFTVGSSVDNTIFNVSGHMSMIGTGRAWRDELGELLGKKKIGNRITDDLDDGTVVFASNCVSAEDYIITNVQLNHDRDSSANIYPHLHWFQTSGKIPNWLLEYRWQINGGWKTPTWSKTKMDIPATSYISGNIHQICYCSGIAVPISSNLSDIVQFRISRDTGNVSTLFSGIDTTSNISAISFDVHLQLNSLGSTSEYIK